MKRKEDMSDLPVYKVQPMDEGMVALALVDVPAVEIGFQAFSKDNPELSKFSIVEEEKRLVSGPLIRCDFKILRKGTDGSLYYIVFDKEVAKGMLMRFLKNGFQNNVNLSHSSFFPSGIEPVEFYIKDSSRGVSPKGFEDIADGSVFCTYHITDDGIWQACKDGTFKGFSLEAYLDKRVEDKLSKVDWIDILLDCIK